MKDDSLMHDFSIVIPTVDEYGDIREVIGQIYDSCDCDDISEIKLVCSKNSTEEYVQYLESLASDFPRVRIIVNRQTVPGVNAAIYEAFYAAAGSHIILLCADMENDPADVRRMIELAKQHPDAIITASRRLRSGDFDEYPKVKRYINILFQQLLHIVFNTKQSDITYLYQCTPKKLLYEYSFSAKANSFLLSLGLLPEREPIPVYEIPSKVGKRKNGYSHLSIPYYFSFIKAIWCELRFYDKRG